MGVPFALVGLYVWITATPDTGIFATHSGVDSPLLFVRFLAFVLLFGTAYLSLAAAVSALASSRRSAIALGLLALLVGVLGGDLAILRSLAGGMSPEEIAGAITLTPNGAFRGLIFEHVIGVAFTPDGRFVQTSRAVGSLVVWILAGIAVAVTTLTYAARVDVVVERARERFGEY
ncbi:copper ABC transporter permease [Halorubrum sp. AJ67]|nr:copper ABC transporter permease [Halorubrum sp. AJ67]